MHYKLSIYLIIIGVSLSTSLRAQETNDSLENKPVLEKLVDAFRIKGKRTVFYISPSVGYDQNSGWEFGLIPLLSISPKNEDVDLYRSSLYSGYYSYSTNGWLNLKTEIEAHRYNKWHLKSKLQYVSKPQKGYSIVDDRPELYVTFDQDLFESNVSLLHNISKRWLVTSDVLFAYSYIDNVHYENSMEGRNSENFILVPTLGIQYDSRNYNNYPDKGIFIDVATGPVFNDYLQHNPAYSQSAFLYYAVDFRAFYALKDKNIFAFQCVSKGALGGMFPLIFDINLGGKNALRGISDSEMYAGSNVSYTQLEFRRMLWWRFGFALHTGIGCVDELSTFSYTYGAGLRFMASEKDRLNFRFDYGRGRFNNSAIFITVGEAF